jgi:hypothetical protein
MSTPSSLTFPLLELTPFPSDRAPKPREIRIMQRELYQQAMAIETTLGGGEHGHLGLLLTPAQYAALPGPPPAFTAPANPGIFLAAAGTAAQIASHQAAHKDRVSTYQRCVDTEKALKAMIIQAVPPTYIASLSDDLFGYANVTSRTLWQALLGNYGSISEDDLAENLEELEAPWDPTSPIEDLLVRATKCTQFALAGGDPITEATTVRLLVQALEKSGVMDEACKDWRKKQAGDRVLDNILPHFKAANKERLRTITTSQAGLSNAAQKQEAKENKMPVAANAGTSKKMFYCWSHGLGFNEKHTSDTCTNKKAGHVDSSTADNMQGGNNTIRRARGEKQVYNPRT